MASGPGGKDPWFAFAKSVVLLTGNVTSIRVLQPATQGLVALVTLCEQVIVYRNETRQLCIRCGHLLEAVLQYQPSPSDTLEAAYDDVGSCITNVWQRIQEDIEHSKVAIQDCFNRFHLATAANHNQWQSEFADATRRDHKEEIMYLSDIRHGQKIANEMMEVYEEQLLDKLNDEPEQKQHIGLSKNLFEIQSAAKVLLPNLHLVSGEITDIDERAIVGTSAMDILRGRYLHSQVVAIKVVRAVEGDERTRRRFDREVGIWQKIHDLDKGKYILPFYGWSLAEDKRPYMVSPWQENGTALAYVKNNDAQVDYREMILNITRGIHVLHCLMDPPVLHGDIRAANILIDTEGNPLIADFGLSKLVEDVTNTPFTESTGVGNIYRWLAPEVYSGNVLLSSDVYSFAMTILELLTHSAPFVEIKHSPEVVVAVANGRNPKRPTDARVVERGLDDGLWSLMMECWNRLPDARPEIVEVLERLGG
ncbi:hypothetical protein V5O48_009245 [Marasmius crinis-equi]|uniref:Protein kinase domain-containing protein n=1 Tax=Marasmius crinis-equi TaxID=585013 RepID=A0ABR3FCA0_9AGAR